MNRDRRRHPPVGVRGQKGVNMRKSLLPVLALLLACETTEPEYFVNLTGDYEGTLTAVYGGTLEMKIRIDQSGDSFTGGGTVDGVVRIHPDVEPVSWHAEIDIRGTVAAGFEPAITMELSDGCVDNELSGVVSGLAIVLHGEVLPADGNCSSPPRGADVIGRFERVESED